VGTRRALLLTARPIGAEEARAIGLVNAVVLPEDLMDVALDTADAIAGNAPLAVQATWRGVRELRDPSSPTRTGARRSSAPLRATDDARGGQRAFVEKRRRSGAAGERLSWSRPRSTSGSSGSWHGRAGPLLRKSYDQSLGTSALKHTPRPGHRRGPARQHAERHPARRRAGVPPGARRRSCRTASRVPRVRRRGERHDATAFSRNDGGLRGAADDSRARRSCSARSSRS
jgi:hypothetical protein